MIHSWNHHFTFISGLFFCGFWRLKTSPRATPRLSHDGAAPAGPAGPAGPGAGAAAAAGAAGGRRLGTAGASAATAAGSSARSGCGLILVSTIDPIWDTLWLCQNSYWKWPFIVDFPMKNGGSFHSYVNLPEGILSSLIWDIYGYLI